jgi:trehalose 6-phosphate synthase
MRQILIIFAGGALAISAIALGFTFVQAYQQRTALESDLQYRTHILADSLVESVEPAYNQNSTSSVERLVDRFTDRERLAGLLVVDATGNDVASSDNLPSGISRREQALKAMDTDLAQGALNAGYFVYATPLHSGTDASLISGALVVVQNASYIDQSIADIWYNNIVRLLLQLVLFFIVVVVLLRFLIITPLARLERSIKSARAEGAPLPPASHAPFFGSVVAEISKLSHSLLQARAAASEEARLRLQQIDTAWTRDRLREFVKTNIKNRPIYVVSNREPYVHRLEKGRLVASVPASGMVTALESLMEACGGTWLAQGSGEADRQAADEDGRLSVPPEEPRYTLRRVFLTEEDVDGFYSGFSNEALWPLCHTAHQRPIFRADDWSAYRKVNGHFAETLLDEIRDVEHPIILVQDFHFALLPKMIKNSRPDAQVGIFWHIPWPAAEQFSICPWRKEILEGMLGADTIGFHTQQYCNNFIETVGKEVESLADFEHFTIAHEGHVSHIDAFPISIAFTDAEKRAKKGDKSGLVQLGITTEYVGLGVERLDYTKGILERFKALEFFFDEHPEFRERFTFLQVAAPSRESVPKYREYAQAVEAEANRINAKFGSGRWQPIHYAHRQFSHEELQPLYRAADVCLVTSLHDGMNLVAKEYVAARDDERGVLILSKFTGASRDLIGALVVNPYSAEETSAAISQALSMSPAKQHQRMKTMRNSVREYNVYRWAAEFLKAVASR